nr:MAG TPA: hypothetical protein [Caudoviricetes sp.]
MTFSITFRIHKENDNTSYSPDTPVMGVPGCVNDLQNQTCVHRGY